MLTIFVMKTENEIHEMIMSNPQLSQHKDLLLSEDLLKKLDYIEWISAASIDDIFEFVVDVNEEYINQELSDFDVDEQK